MMMARTKGMRLYTMGGGSSPVPLADHAGSGWNTPSKTGGGFSAACWYYGRDIYNAMPTKVPIGLIATDVGGTPDEHWSSPEALDACVGPVKKSVLRIAPPVFMLTLGHRCPTVIESAAPPITFLMIR